VKVVVHPEKIAYLMSIGPIATASARAAGRVRDRAKENAPVDKGLLRNSIIAVRQPATKTRIIWRIGSDVEYAIWQEVGTPPIHARRAPFLVFQVKGKWVRTFSTSGVPAARYLTRAVESVSMEDFR